MVNSEIAKGLKEFALAAIELVRGVDYADARVVEIEEEIISVHSGVVEEIKHTKDIGIGVRALYKGFWGFDATSDLSLDSIYKTVKGAIEIAQSSYSAGGNPIKFEKHDPIADTYITPIEKNPFDVKLDDKINLLLKCDEILRKGKYVVGTDLSLRFIRIRTVFASTEDTVIEQTFYESGGGYQVYGVRDGIYARRSYPGAHGGNMNRAGYEFIEKMDFLGNVHRISEELDALLVAPPAPSGIMDLVIHHSQLFLQIHESIGHPLELDRVLGWELSFAGDSFATPDKLDNFKYGSELMNIRADSTVPGGLGTFGYDDEGTPASNTYLIKDGILRNYLSSRDTAPLIGKNSTGAARAMDWSRIPIVRMTNVNLEPGESTLEELIEGIKEGLFIMTNKSWSIDQKRLNFQFSTEIGWRIRKGKLAEIVRSPIYTGITPEFWGSMDGVANDWYLWGVPNCGKGEPHQVMHTGHGTPSARFRNVRVGGLDK